MPTARTADYRILFADDDQTVLTSYGYLFDRPSDPPPPCESVAPRPRFIPTLCRQGEEAVEAVRQAETEGRPFAVAFLDISMPPGIDGVETAARIRALDQDIQIVFITGQTDNRPDEITSRVPPPDKVLYCQKPVEAVEIEQFALSLCSRWSMERELRRLNERQTLLMRSNPAVIYGANPDPEVGIDYVSENIETVFGYRPDALVGDREFWRRQVHPHDLPTVLERFRSPDADDGWYAEYRLRMPDGLYRWVGDHVNICRDEAGQITEMVGCWIDLSQRKAWEHGLAEAKSAAEIANRAKTEFLANISHELRTPLNAILGFTQIICDGPQGPPANEAQYKEYAAIIHESGRRLLDIIDDLLDVAKIDAGKFELHESTFPFESFLRRAVRLIATQAERARLSVQFDLPDRLEALYADEGALKQAVSNLLSNAVKFTRPGGRITIKAGLTRLGEPWFSISDTGIGMTAEHVALALQPFSQAESTLSRSYDGAGLGLFLTKGIIDLHGGTLNIESEPGRGTCVTVAFPASRAFPSESTAQAAS